ncbi:MAG TPA: Ig-like domain-containing protein [Longimicrobium sp.]
MSNRVWSCVLPLLLLSLLAACDGDPAASRPAQVQAVSGSGQSGLTGAALSAELVAKVTGSGGRGVPGVAVEWDVDAGGGTLSATGTLTDAAGEARVRWTLGPGAGTFTARATVAGLAAAVFSATATLPRPAALQVAGGNGQTGAPAAALADSLAVRVVSDEGRAVAGATVAWSVAGGGGALSSATSTTNAAGIAKVRWTLGPAGPQSATATVAGVAPAAFSAHVVPIASITFSPAQAVVVRGSTLQLTATPRDSAGNPLAGRAITWSTSAPEAVTVDAAGMARGAGRGAATITAAGEGRSGTVVVTVAPRPPQPTSLSLSPQQVDVSAADATVDVRVSARVDAGLRQMHVAVDDPSRDQRRTCTGSAAPTDGTSELGMWTCALHLPRGSAAGTWHVSTLSLLDSAGTAVSFTEPELAARGFDTGLQVVSEGGDVTAPELISLVVVPPAVSLTGGRQQRVDFTFTAADAGTGVAIGAVFLNPPNGGGGGCTADPAEGIGAAAGTFHCSMFVPTNGVLGAWGIDLYLDDVVGNTRRYTSEQLQAAGFPFRVLVSQ